MIKMIIYFYLFIPLVCRLAESSTIKGRNHRNDLVPFLSSRLDTQKKDNSLKIVSNEPFIIQFQMPPQSSENVHGGANAKDKKKKDKKRVSKLKPLRKKIRKRREVSETENVEEKPHQSKKPSAEVQKSHNKTDSSVSRLEILKALNTHAKKKEAKKVKTEEVKNIKDVEKTATSVRKKAELSPKSLRDLLSILTLFQNRNLHRDHSPDRDSHVKMIYPNTPKSDSNNYSYKDLIADRERLEQKINYIRNLLNVNNTGADDGVRVRRRSDSDKTANKIAKMFLTLSAVNGLHEKRSKCRDDDDDDRENNVWEKERKPLSRQSSSSNEERYKVKKWIEYMKSKRSSGKTCPCMTNEYNEENDMFPLEQTLTKGYQLAETGGSSEESSDNYRDSPGNSRGRPNKSGLNLNGYREDARRKLRVMANRNRKNYDLPLDDLELYRSRAKQILQNAEEILDKIKEEEEKRLVAPHAVVSRLRELTSRIQGDPRNNENDFMQVIQKNLGWAPQSKSQSGADANSFVENMKSFILDPYEKAKALTDESTRKLSSYLLRNLGKIDSSEEQEEATGKSDQGPQVYHGQEPQKEEMFSANLAKESPESDSFAKQREEHQNWSDTLSAMLGGNDEDVRKENTQEGESKQTKDQEDLLKKRMEEMIKEQEKKISEYSEKPDADENVEKEDSKEEKQDKASKNRKQPDDADTVAEMSESAKANENVEKSNVNVESQGDTIEKESETPKSKSGETESDVIAFKEPEGKTEEFAESVREKVDEKGEDDKADLSLNEQNVKASVDEASPKGGETVSENLEKSDKNVESVEARENRKDDAKGMVMEHEAELKKGWDEEKQRDTESSTEKQEADDKVQSKQDREKDDILSSKHLIFESSERSEDEELEELREDIQKLLEETIGQESMKETEGTDGKQKYDFNKTKTLEDFREVSSSPDSVKLEKQTELDFGETQGEPNAEGENSSSGAVQASQNSKESQQYDGSKEKKASGGKESSAESLVEREGAKNSAESYKQSEKTEDSAEELVEKTENSEEKEKIHALQEITKSEVTDKERDDDTPKSVSADAEDLREESDKQTDNKEKEILRESLNDPAHKGDKTEPSLTASSGEADDEQKSSEVLLQKSLAQDEENFNESKESPSRPENSENENLDKNIEEMTVKANKQGQEVNEEADDTENEEASLKASKPDTDKEATSDERHLKATERELDNRENEDEPQVRAGLRQNEEIEEENEEGGRADFSEDEKTEKENENEPLVRAEVSENEDEEEIEDGPRVRTEQKKDEETELDSEDGSRVIAKLSEDEKIEKENEDEPQVRAEQTEDEETEQDSEDGPRVRAELTENEEMEDDNEDGPRVRAKSSEVEKTENENGNEPHVRAEVTENEKLEEESEDEPRVRTELSNNEKSEAETDEQQVRAELSENEEIEQGNENEPRVHRAQNEKTEEEIEESSLRSENPRKDTDNSKENLMNASESQEKVEAPENEALKDSETENETVDEPLKATANQGDENSEEIESVENEKVEKQKQSENLLENSRETELDEGESVDLNRKPALRMSIRVDMNKQEESVKENEQEGSEESDGTAEGTLNASEENADVKRTKTNEEIQLGAANLNTDQEQPEKVRDSAEKDDELSVRAENINDFGNELDGEYSKDGEVRSTHSGTKRLNEEDAAFGEVNALERENNENDVVEGVNQVKEADTPTEVTVGKKKNDPASEDQNSAGSQSKNTLKVPKSIGKIMRDLGGKEKDEYISLTNLNPEKIDHIIDKIDQAEHQNQLDSEDVDCRKECACADEMNIRSRNIGRYEIVKDFLHWVKDLQLNRVLSDG